MVAVPSQVGADRKAPNAHVRVHRRGKSKQFLAHRTEAGREDLHRDPSGRVGNERSVEIEKSCADAATREEGSTTSWVAEKREGRKLKKGYVEDDRPAAATRTRSGRVSTEQAALGEGAAPRTRRRGPRAHFSLCGLPHRSGRPAGAEFIQVQLAIEDETRSKGRIATRSRKAREKGAVEEGTGRSGLGELGRFPRRRKWERRERRKPYDFRFARGLAR